MPARISRPPPDGAALHRDRARAESFGADAERYDRARPGYPDGLVDTLLAGPGRSGAVCDVLDVGCGTGIAGGLLAARGCSVVGVDPDPRMTAIARRRGLQVEVAPFESWRARGRRFDLVLCGQAWHWIDPDLGVARAADVLRPRGRLAVFWNLGRPPPAARRALAEVYGRLAPDVERYSVLLGNSDGRVRSTVLALERSGRFAAPELHSWEWSRSYTTEQWLEHVLTHSDHQALAPARREELFVQIAAALDRQGGVLAMGYTTRLVSAAVSEG